MTNKKHGAREEGRYRKRESAACADM